MREGSHGNQHQPPPIGVGNRTSQWGGDSPRDSSGRSQLPHDGNRGLELVRQRDQERPQHQHGYQSQEACCGEQEE